MTRAIADLLRDPELRVRMERLGQHRCATFNWQDTARRTLAVYAQVAEQRRQLAAAGAHSASLSRS